MPVREDLADTLTIVLCIDAAELPAEKYVYSDYSEPLGEPRMFRRCSPPMTVVLAPVSVRIDSQVIEATPQT